MNKKPIVLILFLFLIGNALAPLEKLDQALKASIGDPYSDFLSFSITDDGHISLELHASLLKNETLLSDIITAFEDNLSPTYLHISLDDSTAEDHVHSMQDSLKYANSIWAARKLSEADNLSFTDYLRIGLYMVCGAAIGALALPLIITCIVNALGFTPGGVESDSYAADMMSSSGNVVSGSLVAICQSIGAAGLGFCCTLITSILGAVVGAVCGKYIAE